ncbi:MAG: ABC transporter permease [Thermomicrobiales bacterium]|jgi:simple sugar transport system permease protein|nr:ABC transporter permease [Thermomicrobiales bacterium]
MSAGNAASSTIRPPARQAAWRSIVLKPEIGALAGAVAVWVFFAIVAGDRGFLNARGTASYLEVAAELGILAAFVALLMIGGEFDLSLGSTIGASGMIVALMSAQYGYNLWVGILLALAFAIGVGIVNGVLVLKTGLPSFIVTLAMLFMIRGATTGMTLRITNRTQVGGLKDLPGYETASNVFGYDYRLFGANFSGTIVWWLVLTGICSWILLRTRFGNWITGVGGNLQAARNVGVPVSLVKILLFVGTAVSAWLLATIQVISAGSADVLRGEFKEFYAIVAAVIGGTLLTGGYGSVIGAALGALIFGMVQQGIVYAGVDGQWFDFVLGAMLLSAVLVNRFVRMRAVSAR